MKAIDVQSICPYPGLRSFTEEESLYFKGRDVQVDQITSLLEQNKFLMVTGASGEGKSSLIYAGLIPNARAGFFKARYSNWIVASFRPERTPLTNMSLSIAKEFGQNPATVETELKRGFSSLIDLYTNSPFYTDEEDAQWSTLQDNEQKDRRRKAANLVILVDQFEEFFTSPENFANDIPSTDSQTVINLVLETSRIAIKRNLPVYVICTMRSDYIGQCSSFRGLPEHIGFSQFFVPRLKRRDLKQVIEEPAVLSANKISQRLVERLVYDLADGVDQLPILQHALSQVWHAADQGNEEMDLIHYAIVGGMPPGELPDHQLKLFRQWQSTLTPQRLELYKEVGLQSVIDIHANLLYENAYEQYNREHPDKPVTQHVAKRIVALTFSCLTKIDEGRAVRNRMTLAEITSIINIPEITEEIAGNVLNIFREEGNSFIHPFKTSDPATHHLSPNTVLDITHESLIRNWKKLNRWAEKEYEYYSTYLDFEKQINRWVRSGKKSSYLLPLGPLTYFENWYKSAKPNEGWIRRYMVDAETAGEKPSKSLEDMKEFLKKSGRRELLARTFVKYGPRRIFTVLAILIMLGLSSFYLIDANDKKNENVISRVRSQSYKLMESREVDLRDKAFFLIAEERLKKGTLIPYLEKLNFNNRIEQGIEVYKELNFFSRRNKIELQDQVLDLLASNFARSDSLKQPEFLLLQSNRLLVFLAMDNYYRPEKRKEDMMASISNMNIDHVIEFFKNGNLFRPAISSELNLAIQYWLTVGKATTTKVNAVLQLISPLLNPDAEKSFALYYAKGRLEPDGTGPMDFNGGYHTLASLYGALGDGEHVKWCYQQMLANGMRHYFEQSRIVNNHLNVIGYLYQYGHKDVARSIIDWIAANTEDNPPITLLRNVVVRSGYISHLYPLNFDPEFYRAMAGNLYPNLCLIDRTVFDQITDDYDAEIRSLKSPEERDFNLALNAKRKAMFYYKYWYDRNLPVDQKRLDAWLWQSINLYENIDASYLNGTTPSTYLYNVDGTRTKNVTRRALLLYPDYKDGWYSWTYHSDYFFNFLKRNGLLEKLFKTSEDLNLLHLWLTKATTIIPDPSPDTYYKFFKIPDTAFLDVLAFVKQHPQGNQFDKNLPYLVLANRALERGDSIAGLQYFKGLNISTLMRSASSYEYLENVNIENQIKELCGNLAAMGQKEKAIKLAAVFNDDPEKVFAYTTMADKVYTLHSDPDAFVFLDSAFLKKKNINFGILQGEIDPRYVLIRLLSRIGGSSLNAESINLLRDIQEQGKFTGILSRVAGVAHEGNYYRAFTSIPGSLTESQDLECRILMLLEEARRLENIQGNQAWKPMDEYLNWSWYFINFLPV